MKKIKLLIFLLLSFVAIDVVKAVDEDTFTDDIALFSNLDVEVDGKGTNELTDDVITLKINKDLPSDVSKYYAVISNKSTGEFSATASSPTTITKTDGVGTQLKKSGNDLTINTHTYYESNATDLSKLYFTIYADYSDGKLTQISTSERADVYKEVDFSKLEVSHEGLTSSTQEYANLRFSKIKVANVESYIVVICTSKDLLKDSYQDVQAQGGEESTNCVSTYVRELEGSNDLILSYPTPYTNLISLKEGKVSLAVYQEDASKKYTRVSDIKDITRPDDLALGKRTTIFLFEDYTSSFFYNIGEGSRTKYNYKIGVIDDKSLLLKLKNEESGSMAELLEYAKKNKAVLSGTSTFSNSDATLIDQSKVTLGKYYFLYVEVNDPSEYYPIEDIHFYECMKYNGKLWLAQGDDMSWEGVGETKTKTKKNPKTGIATYTAITLSVIALGIIYIKTKKVTKFPQS